MTKSVQFAHGEIEDQKEEIKKLKALCHTACSTVESLTKQLAEVRRNQEADHNKLVYLDDYSRRNSLRLRGIPETDKENWQQSEMKVARLITEKLGYTPEIERAHRIGNKDEKKEQDREILVKFLRYPDKE